MLAIQGNAGPWNLDQRRIADGHHADCANALQSFPALCGSLMVPSDRPGDFRRRPRDDHAQLSLAVEAGEVVVIGLGNFETIPREDQISFDVLSWHHPRAYDGVLAKRERLALSPTDQTQAGI